VLRVIARVNVGGEDSMESAALERGIDPSTSTRSSGRSRRSSTALPWRRWSDSSGTRSERVSDLELESQ
jgi:hypothetical protein